MPEEKKRRLAVLAVALLETKNRDDRVIIIEEMLDLTETLTKLHPDYRKTA